MHSRCWRDAGVRLCRGSSIAEGGPMEVQGHCLCGDLRYEATVVPETSHICNCTDCQTISGSAFRLTVFVTDCSFKFTAGKAATYIKIADSGRRRELGF